MLLEIDKQLVNSDIDEVCEIAFNSSSRILTLLLITLPDKIVAHAIINRR